MYFIRDGVTYYYLLNPKISMYDWLRKTGIFLVRKDYEKELQRVFFLNTVKMCYRVRPK